MGNIDENNDSLIFVNYTVCEEVYKTYMKQRKCVNVAVHGKAINDEVGNENDNGKNQKKNVKKLVSFHNDQITKKNEYLSQNEKNNTVIKIPTLKYQKTDNIIKRRKTYFYNNDKYNKLMNEFKQQELKRIKSFHYIYKWQISIIILFFLSITFFLIGIYIYYESEQVVEVTIEYDSETKYKIFEIKKEMKQPIYIHYKISNFYYNYKHFLIDESHSTYDGKRCKHIKTLEDLYKFRCINGKQTLPELTQNLKIKNKSKIKNSIVGNENDDSQILDEEKCDINILTEKEKKQNIFPCGLVSASIFNDKISLSVKNKNLEINKFPIINYYDLFFYLKKHKKNSEKYQMWLNTFSHEYKNWFAPPMTSSFIKPYGIIKEDLKPGNDYKIIFTQNTWPEQAWKSKKYFQLTTLRPIGNATFELAYAFFLLSFIYFIILIVIFILAKLNFCKLGKTFDYCKMIINNKESKLHPKYQIAYSKKKFYSIKNSYSLRNDKLLTKIDSSENCINHKNIHKNVCICPLH
ncbi:LEM3/CDC50 family protein, putative [Plasmodium berghei]|uniref:LEM3/CDC50 family protein, putative n=2 Tax=Plasmodium berghei TaxID=5821 RepID=A0A509AIE9_PLABA|nr:LEM3/CDC50 family protein, putative [Plasmodium berghei ANKA]CXI10354.1 LEM3/CDC50 family protein, putative [Plasmodium berghei]SCL93004.1 LEM3/CDC50 family protein, putative [Plasmodium berghei]SCM15769.1 LEM3/CDC50 family protein, putative [Plasmodium berghei]SCM17564.1 LEM3/CDC50 family protein, putative [Plasmodium berghei]SCN23014.1 LEM3/CDC50 family protein, putative [Plasmodium berghei]|eukprot:XP_034420375.1 LEM3/CDC50 family protein, putative [Plasmodium berghei ANKA]